MLVVVLGSLAHSEIRCPVTLISGMGDSNSVSITFRNTGKLVVRQLEFNCKLPDNRIYKSASLSCGERNALFFSGMDYTVSYPYQGHLPARVRVSLKSVTFSDGSVWKPPQAASCRVLQMTLRKRK